VPNVTAGALTALEHLAGVRENRTGVSRYNQGLDADSLNKTLVATPKGSCISVDNHQIPSRRMVEGWF
jgi:hypothetical protein